MRKKFRSVVLSCITAGAALAGSMSTASAVEIQIQTMIKK